MSVELKVPPVGESITEVEIGEWLKATGDGAVQDELHVLDGEPSARRVVRSELEIGNLRLGRSADGREAVQRDLHVTLARRARDKRQWTSFLCLSWIRAQFLGQLALQIRLRRIFLFLGGLGFGPQLLQQILELPDQCLLFGDGPFESLDSVGQ